ncbi:hypothetical protein ElyMa_002708000 [Elysia marginata]|uniref:Uncharacterized protein n=1 Tax=Elysia marginata TaxID=1093978 RepID=A0AAV4HEE5_9GAST|nr:hypothetical protein ElyMa_002708000 [Elysia marginata]
MAVYRVCLDINSPWDRLLIVPRVPTFAAGNINQNKGKWGSDTQTSMDTTSQSHTPSKVPTKTTVATNSSMRLGRKAQSQMSLKTGVSSATSGVTVATTLSEPYSSASSSAGDNNARSTMGTEYDPDFDLPRVGLLSSELWTTPLMLWHLLMFVGRNALNMNAL